MRTLEDLCGLWRRAAFGATPADLRRSLALGWDGTLRALLRWDGAPPAEPPPAAFTLPVVKTLTLLQIAGLIRWWMNRMATTATPLREKMTLFWHGHFTTSADPVFSAGLLLRQNETLREGAGGRFADLLKAVARDPAMLIFLDGWRNSKLHPNENFARELLELFTLGRGHYTERDVREAARAFTGWTVSLPSGRFHFDEAQHDGGAKRFMGRVGCFGGDDILDMLADHPQTARHIAGRLYRFFCDADAPPREVERLAAVFRAHDTTILPVVDALLRGAPFRASLQARDGFRSPLELAVGAVRAIGAGLDDLKFIELQRVMGQLPFLPPSVKGWEGGARWIDTCRLLDRMRCTTMLMDGCTLDLTQLLAGARGPQAARRVLWMAGLADASVTTRRALAAVWEQTREPRILLELALASPDFQRR